MEVWCSYGGGTHRNVGEEGSLRRHLDVFLVSKLGVNCELLCVCMVCVAFWFWFFVVLWEEKKKNGEKFAREGCVAFIFPREGHVHPDLPQVKPT